MASTIVKYVILAAFLSLVCIWLSYFAYVHREWEGSQEVKFRKKIMEQQDKISLLEGEMIDSKQAMSKVETRLKDATKSHDAEINNLKAKLREALSQGGKGAAGKTNTDASKADEVKTQQLVNQIIDEGKRSVLGVRPEHALGKDYDRLSNSSKNILHLVSHTHWDREWYLSFETFRGRLVKLLDDVLSRISTDPNFRHFHLDGQFIVADDYLQIRTDSHELLRSANLKGQISLGPWYVQPDEYLVTAESLIRNLQYGMMKATEFGGSSLVGYIPDSFGHIAQMPQILRGFGMHSCMSGRGLPNKRRTEVWWEGSDKSKVLFLYLKNWYCNGLDMPTGSGDSAVAGWVQGQVNKMRHQSSTKHMIAMNGCDHTAPDPNVGTAIVGANKALQGQNVEVVHSNLDDYVNMVSESIARDKVDLETHTGELRDAIEHLANTYSNKVSQKQKNMQVSIMIENWEEPLASIAWKIVPNRKYDHETIWYSWKVLMENHPHDSICGCSAAEVHREVDERFEKAEKVVEECVTMNAIELNKILVNKASFQIDRAVVVMNMNSGDFKGLVFIRMDIPNWVNPSSVGFFVKGEGEGERRKRRLRTEVVRDEGGIWSFQLPDVGFRQSLNVRRAVFAVDIDYLPGLGFKVLEWSENPGNINNEDPKLFKNSVMGVRGTSRTEKVLGTMENEYIKVEVNDDGTINVENKEDGVSYNSLNKMESGADRGDQYVFKHGGGNRLSSGGCAKLIGSKSNALFSVIKIQSKIANDLVLEITYLLSVRSKRVDVAVGFDNNLRNHRLRALFGSPNGIRSVLGDTQFEVLDRGMRHKYLPSLKYVSAVNNGGKAGEETCVTIAHRGLHEFYDDGNHLGITLIRSTDRIGDWGTFPVDSAQDPGWHLFEYGIIVHKGSVDKPENKWVDDTAREFVVEVEGIPGKSVQGFVPEMLVDVKNTRVGLAHHSMGHGGGGEKKFGGNSKEGFEEDEIKLLESEGRRWVDIRGRVVMSSMKKSEEREGLIVRVYNAWGVEEELEVRKGELEWKEIWETDLSEKRIRKVSGEGGVWKFTVGPKKILTLELV
eukprot:TRINITY_DN1373_c0_g1_i1.p1 TRINITY_DN1373_c0_g1~~TRINITY_DN1373_c0_g1_i1.p1  ORF type:complete len:1063 (+),score=295.81 TRINITY_DN1373_c0_g1_i1:82-3270(+)